MSLPHPAAGGTAASAACLEGIVDKDLFCALNIGPSADAAEIRAAYRRAVLTAHPDKGGTSETFNLITTAFNILSCPSTRSSYERERLKMKNNSRVGGGAEKRRSTASRPDPLQTASARLNQALQRLRAMLQYMDKPLRDTLYSSIPLCVQRALLEFMEKSPEKAKEILDCPEQDPRKASSGCTRLGSSLGNKSNAHLDIEQMRIYTRRVHDELAIEHQFILVNVRNRIVEASTADKDFWSKPDEVCQLFQTVLTEHDTSIAELGLRMYVEMRAPEWVGNSIRITTPVLPIAEAIEKRSRLLQARCTSWEVLRTVWVELMQRGRHSCSSVEAENLADQSRQAFLNAQESKLAKQAQQARQRLAQAASTVEQALKHQESLVNKIKNSKQKDVRDINPKRQRSASTMSQSGLSEDGHITWPYLDAKRLSAHTASCMGY